MAAKKKEEVNLNEQLDQELAEQGIDSMVSIAEQLTDSSVDCVSTGFIGLDAVCHPDKMGIPRGRDIEIYSKNSEAGKTTLALQIAKSWQAAGLRVGITDPERTIDNEYMESLGLVCDNDHPGIYGVRMLRRPDGKQMTAEETLNLLQKACQTFDLIIVDSVTALETEANADKDAEDPNKIGSMAQLMSSWLKKNIRKRATILWINQTRQLIGGYNPTGDVRYTTTGGRALNFYASLRLELTVVDKLKEKDEDENSAPIGFKTKVFAFKNKVAPQWRSTNLTFIFGEGFSILFDYFEMALKHKIITKSGGWYYIGEDKWQGKINTYRAIREQPALSEKMIAAVKEWQHGPVHKADEPSK